ncbi:MAG TPA: DUF6132 family protein [Holophagaceae bacterium]|nr:DUF6132 family protein [Holophagaceae bacterium]
MSTPWLRLAGGILVGAALGYAWGRLVGCRTGACPLTATPLRAALYGAFMGLLATFPSRS